MNALEFFQHDAVKLPLTRTTDDFLRFLKDTFDNYLSLVNWLDTADPIAKGIKDDQAEIDFLCKQILEAITAYHSGWPAKAYNRFNDGIDKVWPRFQKLASVTTDHSQYKELYRLRIAGPDEGPFEKKDLFHIRFDDRHIVKRQRYSIPGLPCLYLGATLHVCWLEMGRPNFSSIYIARYETGAGESLRLLDLSLSPTYAASRIALPTPPVFLKEYCVAGAACWPLIAACSVKKKYQNAPFIEEYIIPQLLLQWVTDRDLVDGIQYCSVKLDPRSDYPFATVNFVFPAREPTPEGICAKLKRKFVLTEPASWQLMFPNAVFYDPPRWQPQHENMPIELVKGQQNLYGETDFGIIERKMINIACGPLK
jgi:hypothetical protein